MGTQHCDPDRGGHDVNERSEQARAVRCSTLTFGAQEAETLMEIVVPAGALRR
jgi:hypothetical protein